MPKIVNYDIRKQEIVTNAIPVFSRHGYHATNLSQIADLCGFGRTTIYKYFKNKDEIFLYAIEMLFTGMEQKAKEMNNAHGKSIIERIMMTIHGILEYSTSQKDAMVIILELWLRLKREANTFSESVKNRAYDLKDAFARLLQEGIDKGELHQLDVEAMSFTLFALVESFVIHLSLLDDEGLKSSLVAVEQLLKGLEKK